MADGESQVYFVPIGTIFPPIAAGSKLIKSPLQITCVMPLMRANGFTVTVTVNPAEVQPPGTFGVTKYVAVC